MKIATKLSENLYRKVNNASWKINVHVSGKTYMNFENRDDNWLCIGIDLRHKANRFFEKERVLGIHQIGLCMYTSDSQSLTHSMVSQYNNTSGFRYQKVSFERRK